MHYAETFLREFRTSDSHFLLLLTESWYEVSLQSIRFNSVKQYKNKN